MDGRFSFNQNTDAYDYFKKNSDSKIKKIFTYEDSPNNQSGENFIQNEYRKP